MAGIYSRGQTATEHRSCTFLLQPSVEVSMRPFTRLCSSCLSCSARAALGRRVSSLRVLQRADSAEKSGAHAAAARLYEQAYGLSGFDPARPRRLRRGVPRAAVSKDDGASRPGDGPVDQGYLEPQIDGRQCASASLRADPRWKALRGQDAAASLRRSTKPLRAELILKLADQDQRNRQDFSAVMKKVAARLHRKGWPRSTRSTPPTRRFRRGCARSSALSAGRRARRWPTTVPTPAWLIVQHMPLEEQDGTAAASCRRR